MTAFVGRQTPCIYIVYGDGVHLARPHSHPAVLRQPSFATMLLGYVQANPLNKAGQSPGMPRNIRSRVGQSEDPIPDGMQLTENKYVLRSVYATWSICYLQLSARSFKCAYV